MSQYFLRLCLVGSLVAGPLLPAADVFHAGAARVEIVPPFPTQMGGFFDRKDTFTGVALPIYARALVCEGHGTRVAVVATDLIGVSRELVAAARAKIQYQLEMKQRVRQDLDRPLIVVGYANDYIGYIVTPRAKLTGGYEQAITRVDEHAGRQLTEKAVELVTELFGVSQSTTNE